MMRNRKIRILLIDDDEDDFLIFKKFLAEIPDAPWSVEWASSYTRGQELLHAGLHDICFLDYRLGGGTGLELLKEAIAWGLQIPMVLLTGYGEDEVDFGAMHAGAADYLVKDRVDAKLIERCIRYSIHRFETMAALKQREAEVLMQDRLASIGLLASSLAHEIGTPLGVIRGRAEYLSLQLQDNENIQKNADIIISQIDRVSGLIHSLLNLARGDSHRGKSKVVMNQVIQEVADLLRHEFVKNQVELRNEITDEVLIRLNADTASLHQVILNLLVNSIHAIETARKQGRTTPPHFIRIVAHDLKDRYSIEIQDSGCGISPENQKNLFKPFFTTKEIGKGTGLGLVTTYRIIESLGGSIRVESQEGSGTSFTLILPKAV